MPDKKQMLSAEEAHRRAERVRQLQPGFTVTLRLEVALAVMKQRDLVVNRWLGDGSILEVKHNPKVKGDLNADRKSDHSDPALGVADVLPGKA
jgi:hypothetical protein